MSEHETNLVRQSPAHSWYHEADLPLKRCVAFVAVTTLALWAIYFSPQGEVIDNQFTRPAEFRARRWLGRDPRLDPRIKIYVFGDSTLELLGREDLTVSEWAAVLDGFSPMKPRAILIDKLFGTPSGLSEGSEAIERLKKLPFPVIVGAFVLPNAIPHRAILPTDGRDYNLAHMAGMGKTDSVDSLDSLEWLPIVGGVAYGPSPKIREGFRHIGHLAYEGTGFVNAFIRLSRSQAMPMAPLFVAKKSEWKEGKLFADNKHVPLDRSGRVLINQISPSKLRDVSFSLTGLINRISENRPFAPIAHDAVVVILPGMFTGGTDRVQTVFGIQPGGYQMVSLVNSVLTGKWIKVVPHGWLGILLCSVLGAWLALNLPGIRFWLGLLTTAALVTLVGIFSFSYFSIELPWFFGVMSVMGSALGLFAEMNRRTDRVVLRLRERMAAMLSLSTGLNASEAPPQIDSPAVDNLKHLPMRIGKYLLLEKIGQGGMAEVYLAKSLGDAGFEKLLAVKRIHPFFTSEPERLKLFEFEAKLSSTLSHPNIVHVYDFVHSAAGFLLIMEYLEGKNLAQIQQKLEERNQSIALEYALYIINEVLRALDCAHNRKNELTGAPLGIIHRDISPRNIIASSDSVVKLLDFGIAKARDRDQLTQTGMVRGTPHYISPERAKGLPEDHRSDLFSVGVVLYELLSGKHLFEGINEFVLLSAQTCETVPQSIDELDTPDEIKQILRRALAKDPEQRYADAGKFQFEIQEYLTQNYSSLVPKRLSKLLHELFGEEMMEERKRINMLQKGVDGLNVAPGSSNDLAA